MKVTMQAHHWLVMLLVLVVGWWLGKKGIPSFGA